MEVKTKLNARLAIRQRADLFEANDSATKLAFLRDRATLSTLEERSDSLLNLRLKTKTSTSFVLKRKANSHSKVNESSIGGCPHLYPTDSAIGFPNSYPLESDLAVDSRLSSF